MKKLIALSATMLVAAAGASFAEPIETPVGTAEVSESGVILDGAAGNPDPIDGYITADGSGICASDEGSPYDETSHEEDGATCGP